MLHAPSSFFLPLLHLPSSSIYLHHPPPSYSKLYPSSFILHHTSSSFILYPLSFILHPSSFILHPSSFILHPLSFILYPSSFILYPSCFILYPLSFILHFHPLTYSIFILLFPLSFLIPHYLPVTPSSTSINLHKPSPSPILLLPPSSSTLFHLARCAHLDTWRTSRSLLHPIPCCIDGVVPEAAERWSSG